jgi:hypothetical protein
LPSTAAPLRPTVSAIAAATPIGASFITKPVNTNIASAIDSHSATTALPRSPISSTAIANIMLNTTSGSTSFSAAAFTTLVGTMLMRCCCGVSLAALAAMSLAAWLVSAGSNTPTPGFTRLTATSPTSSASVVTTMK